MTTNPLITIITVCYNAEKDIATTMLSVLNQSYDNIEYIIVDGKSTDKTFTVAKQIAKEFPQKDIKIISEIDCGIYDAMNKGIKAAKGEWLCMMNAGDSFANNNVLSNIFAHNYPANITFIYSNVYQAAYNGQYFIREMIIDEKNLKVIHQGVIYKKKLHEEHGYYIVTKKIIISDYLFFLSIPIEETFKTPYIIAKYQAHGISDQGSWCSQQIHCADVVFRRKTFWGSLFHYIAYKIKNTFLPRKLREYIKLYFSKKHIQTNK